jgi:hypothetical protein
MMKQPPSESISYEDLQLIANLYSEPWYKRALRKVGLYSDEQAIMDAMICWNDIKESGEDAYNISDEDKQRIEAGDMSFMEAYQKYCG